MDMSAGQLRRLVRAAAWRQRSLPATIAGGRESGDRGGRGRRRLAGLLGALGLLPAVLGAQDATGSVRGRVVEGAAQQPLAGVAVRVMGTTLGAMTGTDGSYVIRGIAPGTVELRAQRIGYAPSTQSAAVTAGNVTTMDFTLQVAVVKLEEVVTTATGTQARKELGNAITTVNA